MVRPKIEYLVFVANTNIIVFSRRVTVLKMFHVPGKCSVFDVYLIFEFNWFYKNGRKFETKNTNNCNYLFRCYKFKLIKTLYYPYLSVPLTTVVRR